MENGGYSNVPVWPWGRGFDMWGDLSTTAAEMEYAAAHPQAYGNWIYPSGPSTPPATPPSPASPPPPFGAGSTWANAGPLTLPSWAGGGGGWNGGQVFGATPSPGNAPNGFAKSPFGINNGNFPGGNNNFAKSPFGINNGPGRGGQGGQGQNLFGAGSSYLHDPYMTGNLGSNYYG